MVARRTMVSWGYIAVGAVGAVAVMVVPLALFGPAHGPIYRDPARLVVMSLMAAIAMAWNVVFAWLAFRAQDEFVQTASKFAWYWGGLMGLAVTLPIFAFIAWGGLHWLAPSVPVGIDLLRAMLLGYMLPVGGQFIGFLIVRAWWSATKR